MHPYLSLPDSAFWRRSIAQCPPANVDPVLGAKFQIRPSDRIATAGSCFAQHIAQFLRTTKCTYFVTETVHPEFASVAADFNYGTFTARYGNVYTARQFLQLLQRAYGLFAPAEEAWPEPDGRFRDPFRPEIQPGGFACLAELRADRAQHFAAIRRAMEELDVLVFTLGLTEAWRSAADGAVFPLCPGVRGGRFDPARHVFVNFTVAEVSEDLLAIAAFIKARNPRAKLLLTVSPVPLIATCEPRSVLTSTAYSKAVLLVAAQQVAASSADIAYFPSYEIVTGNHARGRYYAEDLRTVTPEGVAHVMRLFAQHYLALEAPDRPAGPQPDARDMAARAHANMMRDVTRIICDEEALERP